MTSLVATTSTLTRRFRDFLQLLTRPHPRVPQHQRGRAQIQAALVLIYIPCIWLVASWAWLGTPLQALLLVTPFVLFLTYLVNKAGFFRTSSWMAVLLMMAHPLLYLLTLRAYAYPTVTFGMLWFLLPLIASFVLLGIRDVVATLLLITSSLVCAMILRSALTLELVSLGLFILLWISVVLLISSMVHQQDARDHLARMEALRESEARYRTLFSAAAEGILVHRDGHVVECNPAFADQLGYTQEEVRGMDVRLFYAPEIRDRVQSLIEATDLYQVEGIRKDGKRIWAEVHGRPMMMDGVEVRVATVTDITERKKAELQQVTIAVEKEKVAILQRFITNVSHDLRTPLSTINTGLYLIGKVKDDPARLETQIASVQEQVMHLERLIDDLLSMSRLDRRKTGEYRFAWHDVNDLMAALTQEHAPSALQKQIALGFTPGPGLPLALIDEREFKRMMQHLIQNAINFTPEGGEVTLTTAQENEEVVISVRDTGIGISDTERSHIFDYFYRGDEARNPDTGGTGLGLTIAQRISEAHNGRIEVESAPGKGSTFHVRLPITRRAPQVMSSPAPA